MTRSNTNADKVFFVKICFYVLIGILFLPLNVRGELVLDQGFDTGTTGGSSVYGSQWLTQSFQVGIEGTLQQIKLRLFRDTSSSTADDLTAYITIENKLDYVAFAPIPLDDVMSVPGAMVTVDFGERAPNLPINSRWDILLTSSVFSALGSVNWNRDLADPYAAGVAGIYRPPDPQWRQSLPDVDRTFQTFMQPGEVTSPPRIIGTLLVPEPCSVLALLAVGCGSVLVRRRRP